MIKPAVIILAPNSFDRVIGRSWENQFQLVTDTNHLASFTNLDIMFNADRSAPLDRGWKSTNPMAGYYLESFLKLRGYEALAVFDWENDARLRKAMNLDPIAIAFSTTYITDIQMLASCLKLIKAITANVPLIVGGPFIWKQHLQMMHDGAGRLDNAEEWKQYGIDRHDNLLFGPEVDPILRQPIYIANEFGERTFTNILYSLQNGCLQNDILQIPNLVLATKTGAWHATPTANEGVNLNEDYTHWDLIDAMPSLVPLRTSVGCPYRCRYCDFIELHPKVLKRSPVSLAKEIELAKGCGGRFFNFIDDNIFLTKDRITELTTTLLEEELDIVWGGFFRVDRIDDSNVDQLFRSGCRYGMCGIESADDEQLGRMQKGCRQSEIFRGIELSTERGIKLVLTFIVGYPGETKQSIDGTIGFINSLSMTHKGYSSFQLYPFYLLPSTAVDSLEYRKQFNLKGRLGEWSHNTMNAEEARSTWAPYFFKNIHILPYDYYATDCPFWWSVKQRNAAFQLRRKITIDFLDGSEDEVIQRDFAELYRLLCDSGRNTPKWQDLLGSRSAQPGQRSHRVRLGGG